MFICICIQNRTTERTKSRQIKMLKKKKMEIWNANLLDFFFYYLFISICKRSLVSIVFFSFAFCQTHNSFHFYRNCEKVQRMNERWREEEEKKVLKWIMCMIYQQKCPYYNTTHIYKFSEKKKKKETRMTKVK